MLIQIGESQNFIDCFEARTIDEIKTGLSNVPSLPPNTGLLFFLEEETLQSFYMPDSMAFPIDIVMIGNNGKVVECFLDCQPGERDPSTGSYQKFEAVGQWVLEVPAGSCRRMGIFPGVVIHFDDEDCDEGDLL